jgi:outer membrane protein OmpA-like peptidoglycan-associated protein
VSAAPQIDVDEAVRVLSAPAAPPPLAGKVRCDRDSFIPGTLNHPKCQNLGFNLGAASAGADRLPGARRARSETRIASARVEAPNVDLKLTFDLNSAVLTPQDMENTEAIAKAIRNPALAGFHFRIEGYTDKSGSFAINLALSQKRADSAKTYLISLGIDPARLDSKGFGPVLADPEAPNDRANRRVVVRRVDD